MNFLCISDIHDQFDRFVPTVLPDADAVLVAGDLTNYGMRRLQEVNRARSWMAAMLERYAHVFWIGGNHDFDVNQRTFGNLAELGLVCVESAETTFYGLRIGGINLSPCFDQPSLKREWTNMTDQPALDMAAFEALPKLDVLVSHAPPYGCLDCMGLDMTSGKRLLGGSPGLRAYVEREQPRLVVCGHVHEDAGQVSIGGTVIVNVARRGVVIGMAVP